MLGLNLIHASKRGPISPGAKQNETRDVGLENLLAHHSFININVVIKALIQCFSKGIKGVHKWLPLTHIVNSSASTVGGIIRLCVCPTPLIWWTLSCASRLILPFLPIANAYISIYRVSWRGFQNENPDSVCCLAYVECWQSFVTFTFGLEHSSHISRQDLTMTAYSVQNEKDFHQEIQLETIALATKGKESELATKPKLKKFVCQTNCIVQPLRGYFERHGRYVAKHPYPFFIIPLIVTGCLSYGLWHLEIIEDVERLFAPRNGVSKLERKIAADNFYTEKKDHFIPGASSITWMQGPVLRSDAVASQLANGSAASIWKLDIESVLVHESRVLERVAV